MKRTEYTIPQQAEDLANGMDQMDQMRTEAYEMALSRHTLLESTRERERSRLAQKYGERHERVREMDRQLSNGKRYEKAVQTQHEKVSHPVPPLPEGGWQLYGQVVNKSLEPQTDLTVSIFSPGAGWVRELGYTCTDPSGYFNLPVLFPEVVKKYAGKELTLTLTNADKRVVHRDAKPVVLAANTTENRLVILDGKDCNPPEDTHSVVNDSPDPVVDIPKDPKDYVLWGFVRNHQGQPMKGVKVKAVANLPDGDFPLGKEVQTGVDGRYKIAYTADDFHAEKMGIRRPDITLSLLDEHSKATPVKKSIRKAARVARQDVTLGKRCLWW